MHLPQLSIKSLIQNKITLIIYYKKINLAGNISLKLSQAFRCQKQPSMVVLKICSKFTEEHPYRSVISIKLLCKSFQIPLRHGCSPGNLLHIFRTPFPRNATGWLLLRRTTHRWGRPKNTPYLKSVTHVLQE